jgi:hypothetical protein
LVVYINDLINGSAFLPLESKSDTRLEVNPRREAQEILKQRAQRNFASLGLLSFKNNEDKT